MNNRHRTRGFFAILTLGLFAYVGVAHAQESVSYMQVELDVRTDATMAVRETITYDFDQQAREGMYRVLPRTVTYDDLSQSIRIDDVSVSQGDGEPMAHDISRDPQYITIEIGNPSTPQSGQAIYTINYTVNRSIHFGENTDTLIWHINGTQWDVPIETLRVETTLPPDVDIDTLTFRCTVHDATCEELRLEQVADTLHIVGVQTQVLPGTSVVMSLTFPKGIMSAPTTMERFQFWIEMYWVVLLSILSVLSAAIVWLSIGRDPRKKKKISVEYTPVDELSPGALAYLYDGQIRRRHLAAELLMLATSGYMTVRHVPKHDSYMLSCSEKHIALELPESQQLLLQMLQTQEKEMTVQQLFSSQGLHLAEQLIASHKHTIETKAYKRKTPLRTLFAGLCGIFALCAIIFQNYGLVVVWSLFIAALPWALLTLSPPQRTKQGIIALTRAAGFRTYLAASEQQRIAFPSPPVKDAAEFERWLPYAVAFGVERQWSRAFAGTYKTAPSWYDASFGRSFNAGVFMVDLGTFLARVMKYLWHKRS